MPAISGTTRVIGIIADPIVHVRTPEVLNSRLAQSGQDAVVVPFHVSPADLPLVWEGIRRLQNLDGLIVTVPHKKTIIPLCDDLGPNARLIGAANAIHRRHDGDMIGEMFDGLGFVKGLTRNGYDLEGKRVLLVGAGGAASAIAFTLAQANIASLSIANRTREKADQLAASVTAAFPNSAVTSADASPEGHDLIINATSLGLGSKDGLLLNPSSLKPHMTVADVIMRPTRTRLLQAAEDQGCTIHEGLHMLEAQLDLLARFIREGHF